MAYRANDEPPESRDCPTPESVIDQYLKRTKLRKPGMFPPDPFQAARYWMAHQRQPDSFTENATPPTSKGGHWGTPYHDRLLYTLKNFMGLKSIEQMYVIEHVEKGVEWKGEPIDFYTTVVTEAAKMAENKEAYIEDGFVKMHKLARKMAV